jgi:hypothetical protein
LNQAVRERIAHPFAETRVPHWVLALVLLGFGSRPRDQHLPAFASLPARELPRAVAARWPPNALTVAVTGGAALGRRPPRRLQIEAALKRALDRFEYRRARLL